jgi:hypothetical protein
LLHTIVCARLDNCAKCGFLMAADAGLVGYGTPITYTINYSTNAAGLCKATMSCASHHIIDGYYQVVQAVSPSSVNPVVLVSSHQPNISPASYTFTCSASAPFVYSTSSPTIINNPTVYCSQYPKLTDAGMC